MSENNDMKIKPKVILDEEELIRQIVKRPILYDRSLKAYRKLSLRHQYWQQVSDHLGVSVEICRRRWRSLRDSFSKRHKQTNRPQIKWAFYEQMSFIAPFLDNSFGEIDETLLNDFADNSEDAEHESETKPQVLVSSNIDINTTSIPNMTNVQVDDNSIAGNQQQHQQPLSTDPDSDERFLLSCAPVLRRLSARKNSLARLKIQQLLYEIEFDEFNR